MHTNVILTNKRHTYTQSNCTNAELKAWFRRLLRHPARKRSGRILQPWTNTGSVTRMISLLRQWWGTVCWRAN